LISVLFGNENLENEKYANIQFEHKFVLIAKFGNTKFRNETFENKKFGNETLIKEHF
jgi:hypothetical protein